MCGIAGLYSPAEKLQPGRIAPMVEILTHRGPDEGGVYESERVHLGSRRLKVIDLVSGTQPIYSEDRGVVVVYNGEIFNYRQLRSELQAAGHTFATQSDTEVLVHGYEQWGERLVDRLNGQFAFAIWDGKRLFLARDRMGEKPLYYARDGRRLIFASEIKAILKEFPSAPAVDESFWVFDTEVLGRTIFEGIREVPPAHLLTFDGDVLDVRAYWQIPAGPIADRSESDLVEELRTLLIDAVNIRMVADVPVGMFLSGGIDSAAIACIARPETAFSCHFPLGESFEEIEYAKLVAERIGARHTIVRPTPEQFRDRLGRIVWYLDQPIATASTISEFLLAESARDQGIKVILGGQGADEIFAGYVRYLFMLAEERLAQVEELANYHALARFFWNKFAFGDPAERYFELIRRTQPEDRDAYVHLVRDLFSRHEALLDKMGHFDALVSLPSLLTMNDRACAAHGLENRCPFLDHRIVEFAFTLPPTMKIDGYTTKAILRKALRGIVPDPILDRKDKKGLVVPFQQWLNGPLRPWADALVDKLGRRLDLPSGFNGRGGFDRSLYTRVCLELWFENFFPDWPNVS
ncbi:MAG: asparagine synthase (glutamine-hydrolyzing) [Deltaproteobacteria bacterium]|nr:asparagine synthase (glutamine-hydrolyzing) [Deltaproteobacteria bacterium]